MTTTELDPSVIDLTEMLRAIVDGRANVVEVQTSAAQHDGDTETLIFGVAGDRYQRFSITDRDLLNMLAEVRCFVSTLDVDIVEARQQAVEAEQHDCPCGLRLDPDEEVCGASSCIAYLQDERRYEAAL